MVRPDWEIWARSLWYAMENYEPEVEQEIIFIAREGITCERIGFVSLEAKRVYLSDTNIPFDEILYWLPIPKDPRET